MRSRLLFNARGRTTSRIAGRVRAVKRRLQNDAGWWVYRCISDFGSIGHILKGRESQVVARFDRYAATGRSCVRVLGMLGDASWVGRDLAFSPRVSGYWQAADRVVQLANARGLYVEYNIFADAHIVMPDPAERQRTVDDFAAFCRTHPGVFPGLTNEPYKNGWESADHPVLLALADRFAGGLQHRDFSIGDPGDDDENPQDTQRKLETLAQHSNVLVFHSNRRQPPDDARWRRWLDHLAEVPPDTSNPDACFLQQEPIGVYPVYEPGNRENDPDAMVAGEMVALCSESGFCYHWIPEEERVTGVPQFAVNDLPGLTPEAAAVISHVPCNPEWRYVNDSWAGSPTNGITWSGAPGKVRHLARGNQAWSVAYGEADFDNAVRWNAGWTPRVVWRGQRVCVWAVNQ